MYLYLNNIYRRAAVIFSTGWYGACEKNSGNLHTVWKKILHVTWLTGSDVTNHATLYNYWTFVEVGMQCCWKVNFILTPALRRSIWLILLFNNTSCLPKHYLTIVLLYDRYIMYFLPINYLEHWNHWRCNSTMLNYLTLWHLRRWTGGTTFPVPSPIPPTFLPRLPHFPPPSPPLPSPY